MWNYQSFIVRIKQVDGIQLLIYISSHVYILPYFHQSKMITYFKYFVKMYWTKYLYKFAYFVYSIIVFKLFIDPFHGLIY